MSIIYSSNDDKRPEPNKERSPLFNVVLFSILIFIGYSLYTRPTATSTNELIETEKYPIQTNIKPGEVAPFAITAAGNRWTLTPQAHYQISARVLHRSRYWLDWQSKFSPLDLALGWGKLSDSEADKWIDWSQSGRWYYWRWGPGSPYQNTDIIHQSANVHIIPANTNIKHAVLQLKENDIVRLEGYLVNVNGLIKGKPYWWHSSTTRYDTGDESCEILYVNRVIKGSKAFD